MPSRCKDKDKNRIRLWNIQRVMRCPDKLATMRPHHRQFNNVYFLVFVSMLARDEQLKMLRDQSESSVDYTLVGVTKLYKCNVILNSEKFKLTSKNNTTHIRSESSQRKRTRKEARGDNLRCHNTAASSLQRICFPTGFFIRFFRINRYRVKTL